MARSFGKISELPKNDSPVSRTPVIYDSLVFQMPVICDFPASGTPGSRRKRVVILKDNFFLQIGQYGCQNFLLIPNPYAKLKKRHKKVIVRKVLFC